MTGCKRWVWATSIAGQAALVKPPPRWSSPRKAILLWEPLKRSLGKKRREISRDQIDLITEVYAAFAPGSKTLYSEKRKSDCKIECRIFDREEFIVSICFASFLNLFRSAYSRSCSSKSCACSACSVFKLGSFSSPCIARSVLRAASKITSSVLSFCPE